MKHLLILGFIFVYSSGTANAQITARHMLADCRQQQNLYVNTSQHVGSGMEAGILADQSYNAGRCTGSLMTGFAILTGNPELQAACDMSKVVGHPIEEYVDAYVKYGETHGDELDQSNNSSTAIEKVFIATYCHGGKKKK